MSFSNILGQGPAIKILQRIIAGEKIAGAYLFWGPDGVGKKMAALSMAQALNCEKNEIDACGKCISCKAIEKGNYGDLIVLEPKGPVQSHHIGTIREMQSFVSLRSFYEGWKVVVMDDAEKMTEEAAASLLKILEEPPRRTLFILVSSRPENIVKTVLSRCQAVRFLPLTREVERQILEGLSALFKKRGIRDEVLAVSGGSVKKAMAFLTPEREAWRKEILNQWNNTDNIFLISQRISQEEDGGGRQDFIMDTLHLIFTWFRDILFIKEGLGEILNVDYEKELVSQAKKISFPSIWNNLEAVVQAQKDIMRQVNNRLVLDTLFLTLAKSVSVIPCTK